MQATSRAPDDKQRAMTMHSPLLRIGTRGSPLALAQAHEVRDRLAAAFPDLAAPDAVAITVIRTTGDAITDRTLSAIGGKGLFTKEIEAALLDGAIDIAVHSMKDVPTFQPAGLVVDGFLEREDPRDAFFALNAKSLAELPAGAVVGTASLRRQAQVLLARPDLRVVPFRGNVETRLGKLAAGVVDATLLAVAGLNRLGKADRITAILSPEEMLPAVAQGAIGLERRSADAQAARWVAAITDTPTSLRVAAERALLATLDGSCKTPIAALAEFQDDGKLRLRALIVRPDGSERYAAERIGDAADAVRLGNDAGDELRNQAGPGFFDDLTPSEEPAR
jgi:hydroxymethylbilane synthase